MVISVAHVKVSSNNCDTKVVFIDFFIFNKTRKDYRLIVWSAALMLIACGRFGFAT